MSFQDTAVKLDADTVDRLRTALELGKWPDGKPLTAEQRQTTMEAVVLWEHAHLPEEERMGYLPTKGRKPTRGPASANRIPTVNSDDS